MCQLTHSLLVHSSYYRLDLSETIRSVTYDRMVRLPLSLIRNKMARCLLPSVVDLLVFVGVNDFNCLWHAYHDLDLRRPPTTMASREQTLN